MNPAVVLTHYRLPIARLIDHWSWNAVEYTDTGAALYVVCDVTVADAFKGEALPFELLVYPKDLKTFCLAATSNYGIRTACEIGHKLVLKTDGDVVFCGTLAQLLTGDDSTANVPAYHYVESYAARDKVSHVMPDGQGSIAATATNWGRIEGYDERCVGYGAEDNEAVDRLRAIGVSINASARVLHIAHGGKWNRQEGFNPDNGRSNLRLSVRDSGSQPRWGQPQ
jgi:uncharacterized ParB-like nuclease family protein